MSLENFEQHLPVEMATKHDMRPQSCTAWGFASIALGIVTGLVMYTLISAGVAVNEGAARGLTTFAAGTIIIGIMCWLAGKLMERVDAARRDHVHAEAAARAVAADQALIQMDILERLERIESRLSAQHAGAIVGDNVVELPGPDTLALVRRIIDREIHGPSGHVNGRDR